MAAEHIQNQRRAVNYLDLQGRFQIALLRGRQLIVKNDRGGRLLSHQFLDFLQLPLAHIGRRQPVGPLRHLTGHFRPGGPGQISQFLQAIVQLPQVGALL